MNMRGLGKISAQKFCLIVALIEMGRNEKDEDFITKYTVR